jgi:hypothetical protein
VRANTSRRAPSTRRSSVRRGAKPSRPTSRRACCSRTVSALRRSWPR